jgi:hypothetical protein
MAAHSPRFLANGNILPSVAVKIDSSASQGFMVIQATGGSDHVVGIAQVGTYYPQGTLLGAAVESYAAIQYQPINVFGIGEECLWLVDSGAGITQGDYLKVAGASGGAKTIAFGAGAGTIVAVALALETANASEYARVLVLLQPIYGITS